VAGPEGGRGTRFSPEGLCDALLLAWQPALGDAPRANFAANRRRWLDAATGLLSRHPPERLEAALAYMVADEILGSQALTMPGFAKVADQLIARAHARSLRLAERGQPSAVGGEMGWTEARALLERAIHRHGRDGFTEALAELTRSSPLFAGFLERVRWIELCEQPLRYAERTYAEIWAALAHDRTHPREESVA
jgi:hypothetical protein